VRELAEMMVKLALEFPEYRSTARKVRIKRTTADRYYGRGYQDVQNRVPGIANTRRELRWSRASACASAAAHLRGLSRPDRRRPPPSRINAAMKLALKVDVDTFRGTREGVPRLARLLERRGAGRASSSASVPTTPGGP
jgi:hypothetical protein